MTFTDGAFRNSAFRHDASSDGASCRGLHRSAWVVCAVVLLLLGGCGGEQATTAPPDEHWYTLSLGGVRSGHLHNRTDEQIEGNRRLVHARQEMQLSVNRFGQPFETKLAFHSVETPDGELLSFEIAGELGSQKIAQRGRVADGQLVVEGAAPVAMGGDGHVGGFLAVEQALERQPLQSGEKRTLHKIDWFLTAVVVSRIDLAAGGYEPIAIRGNNVELLRVTETLRLPGDATLQQTLWVDRQGRVVKAVMPGGQELLKCAKTEATKPVGSDRFDAGYATAVPIVGAAKDLAASRRVRYRVRLRELNPAQVFVRGVSQQVRPIDAQTAEIIVRAIRPDTPGVSDDSRPAQGDLLPCELIESKDEVVVAMARQVAPTERDGWALAKALEQHVKKSIKVTSFSAALDSAATVARKLEGDCTEHAMLLAGLARARGIPARVAVGLVASGPVFAFHMWTEVHVGDRWVGLDATRPQGGISAAYLKLADTNLAGETGVTGVLRVAEVLGKFEKLEVLEVE